MKRILPIAFCLFFTIQALAQRGDSIETRKHGQFFQNEKRLSTRQLLEMCKANPEAWREMKLAKSNKHTASALACAGALGLGWSLGSAIAGSNPKGVLAGMGAFLVVISIPFSFAYREHDINAVKIYNRDIRKTAMNQINFKMGMTCNGVRVRITF